MSSRSSANQSGKGSRRWSDRLKNLLTFGCMGTQSVDCVEGADSPCCHPDCLFCQYKKDQIEAIGVEKARLLDETARLLDEKARLLDQIKANQQLLVKRRMSKVHQSILLLRQD